MYSGIVRAAGQARDRFAPHIVYADLGHSCGKDCVLDCRHGVEGVRGVADQTERDYQALVEAVNSGRIEAETGI